MENLDNKIITEHPEGGTEIAFDTHEQLKEHYDTLAMQHIAALEANNETEAARLETEMNAVSEKLGLNETELNQAA